LGEKKCLLLKKVVLGLPTSFLTADISQYYHSAPLVCVKKLVLSNISKRIAFGQHLVFDDSAKKLYPPINKNSASGSSRRARG
jgi:hypothetical protein